MKQRTIILIIITLLLVTACSQKDNAPTSAPQTESDQRETLTIFAAASLTEAFSELGELYEAEHPNVRVMLNFAGSQRLAQQLAHGAPADIFASANQLQMLGAVDAERVDPEDMEMFIGNQLVIVYPPDNPGYVRRPLDLSYPIVDLVLAAEEVPAGQYTMKFLDNASQDGALGSDYKSKVLENVVSYEENVRAVLSKVQLGEADAGIVYESDISNLSPLQIGSVEIPSPFNIYANYYIAPVTDSTRSELAEDFISFIFSTEGQDILIKYGFLPLF